MKMNSRSRILNSRNRKKYSSLDSWLNS